MPIELKSKQKHAAASGGAKQKKAVRGRVPTKQNINLAMMGVKRTNWGLLGLVLLLIILAAAAAGKFLIMDRLEEVEAAQAAAEDVHREINLYNAKINSYGELNDVYAHYTYTGMTPEESVRVDRSEIMDLLQRTVILRTDVARWDLKGNLLTVSVQGRTLEDINITAQKMRDDPLVNYCQVNTAATTYTKEQNQDAAPELVSATIIAYLNKPEEVPDK